jgi:prophage maintenance system killer protein
MEDLRIEQIIAIHRHVIDRDGGDSRIISEANLLQLVFLVNATPDSHRKAALAVYLLSAFPSFREGNRRTACSVAQAILAEDGYRILDIVTAMVPLFEGIASFTVEPEDIERWLRENTSRVG